MPNALVPALVQLAVVQLRAGELPGAEADARAAVGLPGILPGNALNAQAWLATVLLARGDVDGAAEAVAATAPVLADPPAVQLHVALAAHAGVQQARGEVHDAARTYRDLLARQRRALVLTPWPWRLDAVRAMRAAGDEDEADAEIEALVADATRWGAASALALALRARATAAEPEVAVTLLASARAMLATTPARLDEAAAIVELGAAHRRTGRRADARPVLQEGLERARACGAPGLVARAHEELVLAGAKPRRLQFSGVESLTAAERRVAELAGKGLTNRAIAQHLYVTPKTVENQLGRAYTKLGITSREALAETLLQ